MKLIVQKPEALNKITCAFVNTIKRTRRETPLVRAVKRTINRRPRKDKLTNLTQSQQPLDEMDLIKEVTPQKRVVEAESDAQLNTGCTENDINSPEFSEKAADKEADKVEDNVNEETQPQEEIQNENCEEDIKENLQPKQAEESWSGDIYYTAPSPYTESEAEFEPFPFQF
ncbi:unnamed protein product [Blepharisma stoltei]|uniref:Uncharacterized protein n=1 Tax=Blepharisma stoltei TaxID=1481888 RepID=A0AAU9IQI8_9CILI|nr:unnamed protein product [Blepharisma stoltei]